MNLKIQKTIKINRRVIFYLIFIFQFFRRVIFYLRKIRILLTKIYTSDIFIVLFFATQNEKSRNYFLKNKIILSVITV